MCRARLVFIFVVLFSLYLLLPIGFPFLIESVSAQDPVTVQITPPITTEVVDLGNGKTKTVFKNGAGQVFMEYEYTFGVLTKTRIIHSQYPNGNVASDFVITTETRGGRTFPRGESTKYDKRGVPTERDVFRTGPNGQGITEKERWNRGRNRWERAPDSRQSSRAESGYKSATQLAGGLQTTTFDTPKGEIVFNVTDDISAGSSLSGTVYVKPDGKDEDEQRTNADELGEYAVSLENQEARSSSTKYDPFKWTLPSSAAGISDLVLRDKKGKEVARTSLLVSPPLIENKTEFQLQEIGQQGESIQTAGIFDGDFSNTSVNIGGEAVPIVAESPTKMVAYNGSNTLGETNFSVTESGQVTEGKFRNVGIRLSAPKLDLLRGEQTILTVRVLGLAGITKPVPLILENKSPTVISMGGGNLQNLLISPNEVEGGIYTTTRPLTGVTRGSFTITGTVIVGNEEENITAQIITAPYDFSAP